MVSEDTLVTVSSIVASFGSAVIVFRVQREMSMETKWVPWADRITFGRPWGRRALPKPLSL